MQTTKRRIAISTLSPSYLHPISILSPSYLHPRFILVVLGLTWSSAKPRKMRPILPRNQKRKNYGPKQRLPSTGNAHKLLDRCNAKPAKEAYGETTSYLGSPLYFSPHRGAASVPSPEKVGYNAVVFLRTLSRSYFVMIISGLSGNEIYCLHQEGLVAGQHRRRQQRLFARRRPQHRPAASRRSPAAKSHYAHRADLRWPPCRHPAAGKRSQ